MAFFRNSLGVGLVSAVAVAMTVTAQAEQLKIGALMPMTGDLQAYGETSLNGIKLAVEEINAAGGDVAYVVGDTQTNPQSGVDAAKKLTALEKVSGIVGALSSGVTIPVAQSVSSVSGVPQISNASTSPVITGLDDKDFLFRTVPSDAFQGVALAQVTMAKGVKSVAIIYVNNDYGKGLADAFSVAYERMGGKVTGSIGFEQKQPSYRGELQKATKGKADALLLIAYPENGSVILRQSLEGGFFTKFVLTDGMKAPEIIDNIGADYLNGTFGTSPEAVATDAKKIFDAAYMKKFGDSEVKPYIDTAYDAVYLMALAAAKAGSADPVAIRGVLRDVANPPGMAVGPGEYAKAVKLISEGKDIDYVGAAGSQNFDATGDVPGTFAHWEIQGGKIVTVKVFEPN